MLETSKKMTMSNVMLERAKNDKMSNGMSNVMLETSKK